MSLVALSAGALMGGAFIHLLPEAVELTEPMTAFGIVLFSFVCFSLLKNCCIGDIAIRGIAISIHSDT
jgi:hypothetical protein